MLGWFCFFHIGFLGRKSPQCQPPFYLKLSFLWDDCVPSTFISPDGRECWLSYSGNFATDWDGETIQKKSPSVVRLTDRLLGYKGSEGSRKYQPRAQLWVMEKTDPALWRSARIITAWYSGTPSACRKMGLLFPRVSPGAGILPLFQSDGSDATARRNHKRFSPTRYKLPYEIQHL